MLSATRPTFDVDATKTSDFRQGILSTPDWALRTPAVVPVGPLASAGSLTGEDLAACGVQALGVDWLRLSIRPGLEIIGALGGLRRFAGWAGPTLAGSAGWAFANAAARMRDEEASVVSPYDGSTRRLTPEAAIGAQVALGLDVVATLDCPDAAAKGARDIARLRLAWAERSLVAGEGRAFVLGSIRVASSTAVIRELGQLPFGGFVLEGLDEVSDPRAEVERALAELPTSALRVVDWPGGISGVGEVVSAGLDVVRLPGEADRAREGVVLTGGGEVSAVSEAWLDDPGPLVASCTCSTCRRFSRAYVRHLFAARELLGPRLVEAHNLTRLAGAVQVGDP